MNDLRNYYLQNLGIGEIWQERLCVDKTTINAITNTFNSSVVQNPEASSHVGTEIRNENPNAWETLQNNIRDCDACSQCGLLGKVPQVPVGQGDVMSMLDVLMVTEFSAPAEINHAEKLFGNIVRAFSDQRNIRVHRTSVLKARAPHVEPFRSQISPADITSCKRFLEQEIRLTQARVLLLFGETAASALLGLDDVPELTSLRKMQHNYQDIPVIVTYSSEEILLNPRLKSEVWADLCRVRKIL